MRDSRRGAEITMQSMPSVLGRWHSLLHVWTLLARWYNRKQEVHLVRVGSLLYPELLHSGRAGPHGHRYGKKVAKNSTRQNNSKRGFERNNMKTFTIDLSVTRGSEKPCWSWVALKKSSSKWTDLQMKTTVILPQKKKLMSIVAIGGSVRIWWIPTRCRQGIDLISRKHCRHCTASRKRRTMRTMKNWSHSSSSWWQWQTCWWHPYYETSPQRWTQTLIERGNLW